ncbi:MAG: 4Fe-4S binding protein [Bacteroidales bacterium]
MNVIYFSPTRTSAKIAESIAYGMGAQSVDELNIQDLTYPDSASVKNYARQEGAVIIAAPVYAGRIAQTAVERLSLIKGEGNPAVVVAVYGNRDYEDALVELQDLAESCGFRTIAGAAFVGEHSYSRPGMPTAGGRPDPSDLEIAFGFGKAVKEKLEQEKSETELILPGNRPYVYKGPFTPATPITADELCTQCGTCIDYCPMDAITLQDEIVSDIELCIKCCACVKICPNEARIFNTPYTELLHKNFSRRREPELYL